MKRYAPPARQRALLLDLVGVLNQLENDDDVQLPVLGATDQRELVLRLVGVVSELLRRHPVDDRGRCGRCRAARSGCRRWLRWPTRKATCLVLSVASFYSTVPIEHVWLQVLAHIGIPRDLDEIRCWLTSRSVDIEPEPVWPSADESVQADVTSPVPTIPMPSAEPLSGRHALTS